MKQQRKSAASGGPATLVCERPVVLVGMMGAGKTTIGRRLASRLGLPFYDSDQEIEKAAGMRVADLFMQHGEASFRRGEAQVLDRLLKGPPHVLATGGGAVLAAETRRLIKARALSIWLKADIDVIARRATRRNTRPLLMEGDPRATLARLLEERSAYYGEADIVVESQSGPHAKTVDAIIDAMLAFVKQDAQSRKANS